MTDRHGECVRGIERRRRRLQAEQQLDHLLNLVLLGAAVSDDGPLHFGRAVLEHGAASLHGRQDYQAPCYEKPAFILVGNEQAGLPPAYEAECDLLVKMPMVGKADSLNAAVATAVMAYEVINQWRKA